MQNFEPIPETNGMYLASPGGEIYSTKTQRVLKTSKGNSGYPQVSLRLNGRSTTRMVHRLVAATFLPNPSSHAVVNHKDGNKGNNAVDNLEWCSYSDNSRHALLTGLSVAPPKWTGKFGAEHNRSVPIYSYDSKGNLLASYEGINDAARKLGILGSTIGHALKDGAFSRLARCFFFYEKKTKKQVKEARMLVENKHRQRGQSNLKSVWAYDRTGKLLGCYNGMDAAAKEYGITAYNVVDSIRYERINTKSGVRFSKIPPE